MNLEARNSKGVQELFQDRSYWVAVTWRSHQALQVHSPTDSEIYFVLFLSTHPYIIYASI